MLKQAGGRLAAQDHANQVLNGGEPMRVQSEKCSVKVRLALPILPQNEAHAAEEGATSGSGIDHAAVLMADEDGLVVWPIRYI